MRFSPPRVPPEVRQNLLTRLAERTAKANLVSAAAALVLGAFLWYEGLGSALAWCLCVSAGNLLRAWLLKALGRPINMRFAWTIPTTGLLIGATVGAGFATYIPIGGPLVAAVLAVLAAGIINSAWTAIYYDPRTLVAYIGPLALGTLVGFLRMGDAAGVVLALMLVLLLGFVFQSAFDRLRDDLALLETNEQLDEAREQALRALNAERMFLARMSHELRTPLNGIIGMTGLLMRSELDAEQLEQAGTTRTCANAMLSLVEDILDFSKAESGMMRLEEVAFEIDEVLEDVVEILGQRAREKGVALHFMRRGKVPRTLVGDPTRLRQVLINLLGNAIKFTEEGHCALEVDARSLRDGRVELCLKVSDTGIGIEPALAERIFEPFAQAESSTTRRFGGTGLGLAIARQIIERMDGRLELESEPGRGSTFRAFVRLARDEGSGLVAATSETLPAALAGCRVLVADASPLMSAFLTEELAALGALAQRVSSAEEAAEVLLRQPPGKDFDLVVLFERGLRVEIAALGAGLREALDGAETKLVIAVGLGFRGDSERARQEGFSALFTLPASTRRIMEMIEFAISGRPVAFRQRRESEGALPARERSRIRALIVDDNPVNRRVAARVLEKLGYRQVAVEGGEQALGELQQQSFDVVLTDIQMPGMSGLELASKIRQQEASGEHCPIIALTAGALAGDREACLRAGIDDVVLKPIDPEALDHAIERLLEAARSGGAVSERAELLRKTARESEVLPAPVEG